MLNPRAFGPPPSVGSGLPKPKGGGLDALAGGRPPELGGDASTLRSLEMLPTYQAPGDASSGEEDDAPLDVPGLADPAASQTPGGGLARLADPPPGPGGLSNDLALAGTAARGAAGIVDAIEGPPTSDRDESADSDAFQQQRAGEREPPLTSGLDVLAGAGTVADLFAPDVAPIDHLLDPNFEDMTPLPGADEQMTPAPDMSPLDLGALESTLGIPLGPNLGGFDEVPANVDPAASGLDLSALEDTLGLQLAPDFDPALAVEPPGTVHLPGEDVIQSDLVTEPPMTDGGGLDLSTSAVLGGLAGAAKIGSAITNEELSDAEKALQAGSGAATVAGAAGVPYASEAGALLNAATATPDIVDNENISDLGKALMVGNQLGGAVGSVAGSMFAGPAGSAIAGGMTQVGDMVLRSWFEDKSHDAREAEETSKIGGGITNSLRNLSVAGTGEDVLDNLRGITELRQSVPEWVFDVVMVSPDGQSIDINALDWPTLRQGVLEMGWAPSVSVQAGISGDSRSRMNQAFEAGIKRQIAAVALAEQGDPDAQAFLEQARDTHFNRIVQAALDQAQQVGEYSPSYWPDPGVPEPYRSAYYERLRSLAAQRATQQNANTYDPLRDQGGP